MLDLFDWITDFVADRDDVTADDIRLAIAREFADGPRERDVLLSQYRERAEDAVRRLNGWLSCDSFGGTVMRTIGCKKEHDEPNVIKATVRDADDELHIECRFSDGQKFAAVRVDSDFPELANRIASFLSANT